MFERGRIERWRELVPCPWLEEPELVPSMVDGDGGGGERAVAAVETSRGHCAMT